MPEVTNILTMKFRTADEKARHVTLHPCKASVTATNAQALMDAMILSDAFVYGPVAKLGATFTQRAVVELF
jgi:hypothetical protein